MATLSIVVVTWQSAESIGPVVRAAMAELEPGDELIVCDNDSSDGTLATVAEHAPAAIRIETGANMGFPAACNLGGERASGELLCFLNPDALVAPGFRDAIVAPHLDPQGPDAWQALVTAERGRVVNTRGGVVHFTGIAWAGGAGEPVGAPEAERPSAAAPVEATATESPPAAAPVEAPAAERPSAAAPRPASEPLGGGAALPEPGFASGACLAISRERFRALGGFAAGFFLYHEDVDLSLRIRLGGGRLALAPAARVDHDYEFDKGPSKWRALERNRWATILRTYPGALLALLAPALLATELALLALAAAGGWLGQKLLAYRDLIGLAPSLLGERRAIQTERRISAGEFARGLTASLDSPYLGRAARIPGLGLALRVYWRAVRLALGR